MLKTMECPAQESSGSEAVPPQGRMSQRRVLSTSRKERVGFGRTARWYVAAALLVIGFCLFIEVRLFLHPPPEPQPRAVRSESLSDFAVSDSTFPALPPPTTT